MKKMYHQFNCSAIMLPEHRSMLKKQNEEEKVKNAEPSFLPDEQQLEEFDRHIKISMENREEVDLYLKTNRKNSLKVSGIVKESEQTYNYICILSEGVYIKVHKKNILKIEKNN